MKVALLGCGAQGKAIAYDLAANNHSVLAIDQNEKACRSLKNLPKRVANNILAKTCDVEDKQKLGSLIQNVDIIVSALPGRYGKYIWKLAIETKKNLVDISYAPDDPFGLDKEAQRRNIKIVVDAGFAPGLSNILIGNAYTKLAPIEKITIYVGGLPQKPKLPLKYTLTWSIEDLIEEYTRPARIIRDYKIVNSTCTFRN
ncbi:MAG: saccharopine dehydrogenase NADP-binding domain-containing protein [candidate division WOR-3 bacterium]|nr:saccharopine dehydrogenase NADP-binding domain-containing protein [candidate division WOR-3 bacterium]